MENTKEAIIHPDGGYGWIIILATTSMNACLLPLVQCFGIIYSEQFEKLGVSTAQTSFLLHLHSAIYCSLGLLGSPLLKRYDFRKVAFLGTFLMSCGIFLTGFAKAYWVFIITVALFVGVGQGIMLPATYLATNTYFKKRLTLAVSFSVTGAAISAIFMPQLCTKLLEELDARSTVWVLGAISLIGIACCFLLKPLKAKESEVAQAQTELEILSNNDGEEKVYKETTQPVKEELKFHEDILKKIHDMFNLELLKDCTYVTTILGLSISFASEYNTVFLIQFIMKSLKFERADISWIVSVQAVADITGRLGVPFIAHLLNAPPKLMYCGSLILATISRTLFASFFHSRPTVYFCIVLLGLAKGIKAVFQSVIIPKYVSLDKLPAANGLNMLLTGVSNLAIGSAIGAIADASGSKVIALYASSILSLGCVLLWTIYHVMHRRKITRDQ